MDPSKGYYCLVQFNPDPSRSEAANIGVLLFSPAHRFIAVRTSTSNRRIEKFFERGSFDPFQVNEAKRALEERLQIERDRFETLDDLRTFIGMRANNLVLTEPRVVRVEEPKSTLETLYEKLVGRLAPQRAASPGIPLLQETFTRLADSKGVRINTTFKVPRINRNMRVPYAFQNGVLNLVRPEPFSADRNSAQRIASVLTIEGRLIEKYSHEEGDRAKLIVVSAAPESAEGKSLEDQVAPIFAVDRVEFIRRSQVADFTKQLEQEILSHP